MLEPHEHTTAAVRSAITGVVVEHEARATQQLRAQGGIMVATGGTATLWPLRDPDA